MHRDNIDPKNSKSLSQDTIKALSKADLHVHLNGAIPTDLAKDLLVPIRNELPLDFDIDSDLQVLNPVLSLKDYFKPWLGLKQLPRGRSCLQKMVDGALNYLEADGVSYAELRNSPFNISELNGISMRETVEWLTEAVAIADSQHGVTARLILSISRFRFDFELAKSLLQAIKDANSGKYIVGLDLSGNEDTPIPETVADLFREAKDELGLGITVHAGETGDQRNIEWAIECCNADRIGHALALNKSPQLVELVIKRDVCIEVCLHGNLRTGYVQNIAEHPIHEFIRVGVPFVLCSDNPAVNAVPLSEDYVLFATATGRYDILKEMAERQAHYAFGRR